MHHIIYIWLKKTKQTTLVLKPRSLTTFLQRYHKLSIYIWIISLIMLLVTQIQFCYSNSLVFCLCLSKSRPLTIQLLLRWFLRGGVNRDAWGVTWIPQCLLHCTDMFPPKRADVNLRALKWVQVLGIRCLVICPASLIKQDMTARVWQHASAHTHLYGVGPALSTLCCGPVQEELLDNE